MLKKLARRILLRGSSRRLLSNPFLQPAWEYLHKLSLYGMNYGGGNDVADSGELWTLRWLLQRHQSSQPGRPAVIFDVGAHDGEYALSAAEIFGDEARIYSFEPSVAACRTLRESTADRPNILVHQFALGEHQGKVPLYYDGVGTTTASVHPEAHVSASDVAVGRIMTEEVVLRTVDDVCEEERVAHIDVMKIDVEGNERNVLLGAERMIRTGAIGAIQFEFGVAQLGSRSSFRDIYQLLSSRYQIHRILGRGLSRALEPYDVIYEIYRTTNYLALLRDGRSR
jgi:FkbM family methyltransferase